MSTSQRIRPVSQPRRRGTGHEQPARSGAQAANPSPQVVDDEAIERAAEEVRALTRRTRLGLALDVGAIVCRRLYGGDPSGYHGRGRKHESLRRLAARLAELDSMSPSGLYRCLAAHELLAGCASVSTWKHVSISHVCAVFPLSDADAQRALLEEAEREKMSVSEIRERVGPGATKRSAGRKPQVRSFLVGVRQMLSDVENAERALTSATARRTLTVTQRLELFAEVMRLREALDRLQPLLSPKDE